MELRITLADASLDIAVSRNDPRLLLDNSERPFSPLCLITPVCMEMDHTMEESIYFSQKKPRQLSRKDVWLLN